MNNTEKKKHKKKSQVEIVELLIDFFYFTFTAATFHSTKVMKILTSTLAHHHCHRLQGALLYSFNPNLIK